MIEQFCQDAHAWLSQSPSHVAVLHCKAGKGRTGFMIACYLLYCGLFSEAEEALRFYAIRRTKNAKGVTIPSQIRFCHYYQRLLQARKIPYPPSTQHPHVTIPLPTPAPSNPVLLLAIRLHGIPRATQGKELSFTIKQADSSYASNKAAISVLRSSPPAPPTLTLVSSSSARGISSMQGDVQLVLYAETRFDQVKLLQCWFNTRFLGEEMEAVRCRGETETVRRMTQDEDSGEGGSGGRGGGGGVDGGVKGVCDEIHGDRWALVLSKPQLDKACKDVKHKNFPADFKLELVFAHVL